IHPGMMTLHPSGITHGPHPKALAASRQGSGGETDEVAVMIDARDALGVAALPDGIEWPGYVDSWKAR
ncbi:MAG: homogentisate 1,2-dioxygenase, partial [Gammaproteobacteria bacterium]